MNGSEYKGLFAEDVGNVKFSYQELFTVLFDVEWTLNARPLNYEHNEVDGKVLTPSHFIYERRIKSLPDDIIEPTLYLGYWVASGHQGF